MPDLQNQTIFRKHDGFMLFYVIYADLF